MSNEGRILFGGDTVKLIQNTAYPWDGIISIHVDTQRERNMMLRLRIPGWAQNKAVDGNLYRFTLQSRLRLMVPMRHSGSRMAMPASKGHGNQAIVWF